MIIGNGLIAQAFKDKDQEDVIIFASGISHSKTSNTEECERELKLLGETIKSNPAKKIIYFSTYSIDDPDAKENLYVKHKLRLENYLKENAADYLIIRTGNIVGRSGNPETIFNYLSQMIQADKPYQLWVGATRNFLDIEDFSLMVELLIKKEGVKQIVYILNPEDTKMPEAVKCFEELLGKKSKHTELQKGFTITSDKTLSTSLFNELGLKRTDYFKNLVKKYALHEAQ